MEFSTAWLEWLVAFTGYELMLFASVGILLFGLDDLLVDAAWLAMRGRADTKAQDRRRADAARFTGPIAIFIPAWDEHRVLAATVRRMLAAWQEEDVRLYIGCYPNDAATLFAISPLIARDRRLRLVVGQGDGPTTKGDNLNRLWTAMGEDERAERRRFAAVVLHDAEDHVHAEELALYRRHLVDNAMVQIPVVPLLDLDAPWIGGHYADEFAEAHGKDLAVRARLGVPIPSAGVGCALTRNALSLLALERGGNPFRPDSLTEDYEIGMLIGAYGLGSRFVDETGADGRRIASCGGFPGTMEESVRQKARWVAGIALAGWDHLGWPGSRQDGAVQASGGRWVARWMLWRDRRAPLSAVILLAAYASLVVTLVGVVGHQFLGWAPPRLDPALQILLALNGALLLWRLGMRGHFTARTYGWREALRAVPRSFISNVVAILAARRAIILYCRMLRSGQVIWDKTEHRENEGGAAVAAPAIRMIRR